MASKALLLQALTTAAKVSKSLLYILFTFKSIFFYQNMLMRKEVNNCLSVVSYKKIIFNLHCFFLFIIFALLINCIKVADQVLISFLFELSVQNFQRLVDLDEKSRFVQNLRVLRMNQKDRYR